MVAAVGRDQLAALGLVRVLPVVKPLFQGLRDGFALADFVLLVVGRGRRQSSFRYMLITSLSSCTIITYFLWERFYELFAYKASLARV